MQRSQTEVELPQERTALGSGSIPPPLLWDQPFSTVMHHVQFLPTDLIPHFCSVTQTWAWDAQPRSPSSSRRPDVVWHLQIWEKSCQTIPLVHEVRKRTERLLGKMRVRREYVAVAPQNISLFETQPFPWHLPCCPLDKEPLETAVIKWWPGAPSLSQEFTVCILIQGPPHPKQCLCTPCVCYV